LLCEEEINNQQLNTKCFCWVVFVECDSITQYSWDIVCANYVHTKQTANTHYIRVVACLFNSYTLDKTYYVD